MVMKASDRELIQFYRDMIGWRMQLISTFEDYKNTIDGLKKSLYRKSGIGSKLIKLGTILIVIPIPVISEILGVILVFLGILSSRTIKIYSIKEVGYTFNMVASSIIKLKEEILLESRLTNV